MTTTPPTQPAPADVWAALDYDNPAALLAQLRPAYYRLIAGEAEAEIRGADHRAVKFHAGHVKQLDAVIKDLEVKVQAASGRRSRFALVGRMR
jgi:hypothetical protein